MAPDQSRLAHAVFKHEQLLISILPIPGWGGVWVGGWVGCEDREVDPKESNAFRCTIS